MDEIFRFLFLRPPAPGKPVTVTPSAAFAADPAQAHNAPNRKGRAEGGRRPARLVGARRRQAGRPHPGAALIATQEALAALDDPTSEQATEAVKTAFGKPPGQVAGSPDFAKDRDRLADNLLAAKLLSRDHAVEARQMDALLRLMALIDRLAANDADLKADPTAQPCRREGM